MSPPPESLYLGHTRRESPSDCTEEDRQTYDEFSIAQLKPLPLLPSSDEFDPYLLEHPLVSQSSIPPLTTVPQLAHALGPDNTPHTTEIDTIPCAGVRIPHGPLTGLLGWRLVVRSASSTKEKRGWWNDRTDRRSSDVTSLVQTLRSHSQPYTEAPILPVSMSALSLPLFPPVLSPTAWSPNEMFRPSLIMLPRHARFSSSHSQIISQSQPQLDQTLPSFSNVLIVNFILDTSLPYSIISQDTLIALGYPSSASRLANRPQDDMITLSIQNIPTRFRVARLNEASRLGVQFLHDAGVSVFFPKDGDGVGPVLYVESARLLKGVPRTISLQGIGAKSTLPQRVRALLGLS